MNKEQIIQGIADRIKAEETKHSHRKYRSNETKEMWN